MLCARLCGCICFVLAWVSPCCAQLGRDLNAIHAEFKDDGINVGIDQSLGVPCWAAGGKEWRGQRNADRSFVLVITYSENRKLRKGYLAHRVKGEKGEVAYADKPGPDTGWQFLPVKRVDAGKPKGDGWCVLTFEDEDGKEWYIGKGDRVEEKEPKRGVISPRWPMTLTKDIKEAVAVDVYPLD